MNKTSDLIADIKAVGAKYPQTYGITKDAMDEILRLRDALQQRDDWATAGKGTLARCGYCGERLEAGHRSDCPIVTHPMSKEQVAEIDHTPSEIEVLRIALAMAIHDKNWGVRNWNRCNPVYDGWTIDGTAYFPQSASVEMYIEEARKRSPKVVPVDKEEQPA